MKRSSSVSGAFPLPIAKLGCLQDFVVSDCYHSSEITLGDFVCFRLGYDFNYNANSAQFAEIGAVEIIAQAVIGVQNPAVATGSAGDAPLQ